MSETDVLHEQQKKTGKSTVIIIAILCVLVTAVVVLAVLHRSTMPEGHLELQAAREFLITAGEDTRNVSLSDLHTIGQMEISSSPRGELRTFTGVPLVRIFEHFDLDYSEVRTVVFTALDGFVTAVSIAEALDEANVFIVFEEDGRPLGTREEGGHGPYMLVVAQDSFPNRWARYIAEITLS